MRSLKTEDLMSAPLASHRKGETDARYRGKLSQILEDLSRRSRGRMSAQYFEDLAAGIVGEGYWRINRVRGLYISCWAEVGYFRGSYKKAFKHWEDNKPAI